MNRCDQLVLRDKWSAEGNVYTYIYVFFFLDRGFKTAFGEMNRQISASALATGKILIDRVNNANRRFKVNDGTFE